MASLHRFAKQYQPSIVYSANSHLESLFVSAIATVLAIRTFLKLTGYPQLGGGGLHIAHTFWGGLFMLSAIIILVSFLGDKSRGVAAVLGGIGLGFFIDEIGKFITSDNDYFFKPSAMLIYVFFLMLWFLFRWLNERKVNSKRAMVANVFELLQEGLLFGLSAPEKKQLDTYFASLDKADKLVFHLEKVSHMVEARSRADEPSWFYKLNNYAVTQYKMFISWRYFNAALLSIFIVQGLVSMSSAINFIVDIWQLHGFDIDENLLRATTGQVIGGVIYSWLIVVGLYQLQSSRRQAYTTLRMALLINIFVTEFFAFYNLQFWAAFGLALNLFLLGAVNYALQLERRTKEATN